MSVASRAILSNFFEEQCTQNYQQYLSGLSRALFPTTFLKIAVWTGAKEYFNTVGFFCFLQKKFAKFCWILQG